ncbi:MAG: alpha-amylase family glycosyl hydrolase [Gammaproteobacteria bacterium]
MADLLARRNTAFVLWHVTPAIDVPELLIGWLQPGTPLTLIGEQRLRLRQVAGFPDLWELPAGQCNLNDGWIYYYWFEVTASHPERPPSRIRITDPLATAVDWRLLGPKLPPPFTDDDRYPASSIKFSGGRLVAADVGGEVTNFIGEPMPDTLPPNNRLVIYELPAAWARSGPAGGREVGVGSFRDVIALIEANAGGATFEDLEVTHPGRSYLADELGVNALELLPAADSVYRREWGYGTTNYFAPDFELGFPLTYSWPAPNRDLAALVGVCHGHRMRFMADMVMAFSKSHPYLAAACDDFFILDPASAPADPDAHSSRGSGELRNGFGASLFRYSHFVDAYDPVSGQRLTVSPARQLMKTVLDRWIQDFHIDGVRLDSIENIASWDFVQELKDHARLRNQERYAALGISRKSDERFIVVGEELSEPHELLTQHRLDGLWHQAFKDYIRMALIGRNHENEPSFEATVRRAIDCREFGYEDLSQAVIYLTSHDVEGYRNERLFNFFTRSGVLDVERRCKLAFACLLTAIGIPMILAGEEFADQHDLFDTSGNVTQGSGKQVDPVNFSRLGDDWRVRIKDYVARLIKLRTTYDALSVNDVNFIHTDFQDGKRVLVWQRGRPGSNSQVVVVANFSDFATPDSHEPTAEYGVPNWPATPAGARWLEVPQDRWVEPDRIGREPLFAWEAKVYALF